MNKNELNKQNILFFTRTMDLGGTENVVLQLCEILNECVNKIIVCSAGGINVHKINEMGIVHYTVPDIACKSPTIILKIVAILKKIVRKEKITVIHTHHRMAAFYVSMLMLYKKCVFINTSHNIFFDKKVLTRFAYKHGNLIACGERVKKNLVNIYRLPEEQVTVIHNAVKPLDGKVVADFFIKKLHDEGNFVIGNIGRLSKQKGMEYFVKAIPKVIAKCPNTRFVIVGKGEDEDKLREIAKDLAVEKFLTFLGYRDDVRSLMSQLDLIVLSSLWEGLPLTPIEAFSVGKTIVATAVDGTVEIVENNKNGILIKERDFEAVANGIILMIENPDRKKMMETNARQLYNERFNSEIYEKKIIDFYKGVISHI